MHELMYLVMVLRVELCGNLPSRHLSFAFSLQRRPIPLKDTSPPHNIHKKLKTEHKTTYKHQKQTQNTKQPTQILS